MPSGQNHKMKLTALERILREETDAEHGITMTEIQKRLWEDYEITAGRKSLYNDISYINDYLDLEVTGQKKGADFTYRIIRKTFSLAELKLLADSVASSRFISASKSKELIKKLSSLASKYEARQLSRQLYVSGRVKTMNESIYSVVDDIHRAITEDKQIQFDYMQWTPQKKLEKKKSYVASPWGLVRDRENYYLVAYDNLQNKIKHFRVDKIKNVIRTEIKRKGREDYRIEISDIPICHFGMYGGEIRTVRLKFKEEKLNPIIDRLGKDIEITPSSENGWYNVSVDIVISGQFYGWVFGLGDGIIIEGPKSVREDYLKKMRDCLEAYSEK